MKTAKFLEDSSLLTEGFSEPNKNETKEQKGGYLSMLLGTLRASLLGNILGGKGDVQGGERAYREGQNF